MAEISFESQVQMKLELSEKELNDVKQFIKQAGNMKFYAKDIDLASRFLRAKKFDLQAALDLYSKHQILRTKEDLFAINPLDPDVLKELLSEKFTFLLKTDRISGATICIFTAKFHFPSVSSQQCVLKALLFQLDAALSTIAAQKNGLLFVYNMTESLYSNFDVQLNFKILNLLKGAYPAKLSKVIILTPPLWFRASFNFLRLFVKEKLQNRIFIVTSVDALHQHLTKEVLPPTLGGCSTHSHTQWLKKALQLMGYSESSLYSRNINGFSQSLKTPQKIKNNNNIVTINQSFDQLDRDCVPSKSDDDNTSDWDFTTVNGSLTDTSSKTEELSPESNCSVLQPIGLCDQKSFTSSTSGVVCSDQILSPTSVGAVDSNDIVSPVPPPAMINDDLFNSTMDNSFHDDQNNNAMNNTLDYHSDYEMLSISSWELNLEQSGDEDAIENNDETMMTEINSNENCNTLANNTPNLLCSSAKTPLKSVDATHFFRKVQLKRRNAVREDAKKSRKEQPSWSHYRPEQDRSLHNAIHFDVGTDGVDFDKGVTIDYFVTSDSHSFYSTLNEFRSELVYGNIPQFTSYSKPCNAAKNRYSDIQCIESSRVKLIRDINCDETVGDNYPLNLKPTDYIHANWVDSYRQKNAFICAQGPLCTTVSDFWHMILQYRSPIIVMTTRPREQNREKCYQYWPETVGDTKLITGINGLFDQFEVTTLRSKEFGPNCPSEGVCENQAEHWYRVTLLHVKNTRTNQEHRVNHFYFHSWPDQGIPQSSEGFLHFILQIRQTYRLNIAKLGYETEMDQPIPPPPIVVHCSAGIGRSGTYIVTDICSKSLSDCGRFNLHQTMIKVRSQRYKCVQNAYQYLYCRNTLIEYARHFGLLPNQNSNSICKDVDEEDDDEVGEVVESDVDDEEFDEIDDDIIDEAGPSDSE